MHTTSNKNSPVNIKKNQISISFNKHKKTKQNQIDYSQIGKKPILEIVCKLEDIMNHIQMYVVFEDYNIFDDIETIRYLY